MEIAVDISLYPIRDDFLPPIQDVITRLKSYENVAVQTNAMSTQVRGDYDDVMSLLQREIRTSFATEPKAVFVVKILNNPSGSEA